ncbi:hypothetical protein [Streptomyces avermitilis]|uniref:hypothetical protein n=1 Tax=Streptomyces avermitilis TaxID=33903 RepID=UPI0037F5D90A
MPDLPRRDFTASAPNRAWVGDITYLPIAGGKFLYLATVIDVHFPLARLLQPPAQAHHDRLPRAGRLRAEINYAADNAAAESFFASLKREILPDRRSGPTEPAARLEVFAAAGWTTSSSTAITGQYGSKAFADACHRTGIRRSMGAVGISLLSS